MHADGEDEAGSLQQDDLLLSGDEAHKAVAHKTGDEIS